jgi:hypothetical protein
MDVILDFFCCFEMASWPSKEAFKSRALHKNDVGRNAASRAATVHPSVMSNLLKTIEVTAQAARL